MAEKAFPASVATVIPEALTTQPARNDCRTATELADNQTITAALLHRLLHHARIVQHLGELPIVRTGRRLEPLKRTSFAVCFRTVRAVRNVPFTDCASGAGLGSALGRTARRSAGPIFTRIICLGILVIVDRSSDMPA